MGACRAGTKTAFSFGDELTAKDANYAYDGFGTGLQRTSNVGEYASNPWGFHDMHGNVYEWCADWYEEYTSGAVSGPCRPCGRLLPRRARWFLAPHGGHRPFRGSAQVRARQQQQLPGLPPQSPTGQQVAE
jgi:formylglycine-generating enzyme required for sulfatase activity